MRNNYLESSNFLHMGVALHSNGFILTGGWAWSSVLTVNNKSPRLVPGIQVLAQSSQMSCYLGGRKSLHKHFQAFYLKTKQAKKTRVLCVIRKQLLMTLIKRIYN